MKEKIIKILEKKAECTMNGHADFDNVDVTQFDGIAEEIVKFCNLHFVNGSTCNKYDELKKWLLDKKASKSLADWDCVHHQEVLDKMAELDNTD